VVLWELTVYMLRFLIKTILCIITFTLFGACTFRTVSRHPLSITYMLKVKLSLCLTSHHAMKTYWGVEV